MNRRLSLPRSHRPAVAFRALIFRSAAALALALLTICFAVGCSDKESWFVEPPPFPPFTLPRTTPENVLFNLRAIYNGADDSVRTQADTLRWGEMYQSLFHPDTFTFYFIESDRPPWLTNPWWGLGEEVHSFRVLLLQKALGNIDEIALGWTVNASEPDGRIDAGNPPQLLHPTWRHVYVAGILLDVVVGENIFRVPNGCADFYLAPDPANPSLWVITEWYDRQPAGGNGIPLGRAPLSGVDVMSWGRMKILLH